MTHHLRKLEFSFDIESRITCTGSITFKLVRALGIVVWPDEALDECSRRSLDFSVDNDGLVSFIGDDDGANLYACFEFALLRVVSLIVGCCTQGLTLYSSAS